MSQKSTKIKSKKILPAVGESKVWLCGLGLTLGITMVIVLLGYIFIKGMDVFTPKPIHIYEIETVEGDTTTNKRYLGEFRRAETRQLPGQQPEELSNLFVGSREFGGAFHWVEDQQIKSKETPENAMRIERMKIGFVMGIPLEIKIGDGRVVKADAPEFDNEVEKALAEVVKRRSEIRSLEVGDIGKVAARITNSQLDIKGIEKNESLSEDERKSKIAAIEAKLAEWQKESDMLIAKAGGMRDEQKKYTLVYDIIRRDQPVELSFDEIVSIEQPNKLGVGGKTATFFSRMWNFVTAWPRDANTDGGIWPAIFGTFVMTIVMSIFVTPFGVIAAIYLREYAKQGMIVRAVRISVNNLAGVPSIVFGVFGVAFFIYTLGSFVDGGPTDPVKTGTFWILAISFIVLTFAAVAASIHLSPKPGRPPASEAMRMLTTALWVAVIIVAIIMIWKNPFFSGFYNNALPTPTFGTGGMLWASLTLALLTLPVVIVATEEALAAVPRGVREAALASGASKWQMIQRVVLPSSTPGIMTGVILAMARGAGEVAPLMLVGVIPAASTLLIDGVAPFIHAERKFMHLGFHIYDVGFQSPDSEAARPLVFATTFVLILLIIVMNLAAIILRNRLRKRLQVNAF